ncbi:MAG: MOSC domain-containing protein [Acaryochloridaceae cyanobacterium CSU_3_4]|nr:MOSC domain-containing protein [Acaryochloridaceae cyanobacterium CSU_3_4]
MVKPYLARIDLYPFKSLDGVRVKMARVLSSGALEHDREYALFDHQGRVVNGKRCAQIHRLRSQFTDNFQTIALGDINESTAQVFHVDRDLASLEAWLSNYLQRDIHIQHNSTMGFPDDTQSPGPTLISTATLEIIASWFPPLTLAEIRRRFRTNLEIGGVPAFWEDQLFAAADQRVQFQIGSLVLEGVNPCQRCIVPSRDSHSGAATAQFQKIFSHNRQQSLLDGVNRDRFNHFYRLAVNTQVSKAQGKTITEGDVLTIKGIVDVALLQA